MYPIIAIIENNPLEKIAVLPESKFLDISLVVQYEIIGSIIITYPNNPLMRFHVPYSIGVNVRVTINVKIKPVKTLIIPITNDIKPE